MRKHYILLAEDDPDDEDLFSQAFSAENPGMEVVCVHNGQQMIDYLLDCPSDNLPALLLIDYDLPLGRADEVLEQLSRSDRYNNIPKLVWSTSCRREFVHRCLERGARVYLSKPVTMKELSSLLIAIRLALC